MRGRSWAGLQGGDMLVNHLGHVEDLLLSDLTYEYPRSM